MHAHPGRTWKLQPFTRTDIWLKNTRPEVAGTQYDSKRAYSVSALAQHSDSFAFSSKQLNAYVHLIGTNCGDFGVLVEIRLFSRPRRCTVPSVNTHTTPLQATHTCEDAVAYRKSRKKSWARFAHLAQQPKCCLGNKQATQAHTCKHAVSSSTCSTNYCASPSFIIFKLASSWRRRVLIDCASAL